MALSGCTADRDPSGTDTESPERPIPLETIESPTLDSHCDPVALPLSAMLGGERHDRDDGGEPCFDGATTSLGLENERDEAVSVTVTVESSEGEDVFEATYDLDPDERVVERSVVPAHDDHTVTVAVDDEPVAGSWDGSSCYRHGIAILPEGVAIGYVEPFWGRGDTQYDCYAGDDSELAIFNRPEEPVPRTVHVRICDECTDETIERTLEIDPGGVGIVDELLAVGGDFDVTVDVVDGGRASRAFDGVCGGISAAIRDDGDVELRDYIA